MSHSAVLGIAMQHRQKLLPASNDRIRVSLLQQLSLDPNTLGSESFKPYDLTFPEPRVRESPATSQNGTIKTQAGKTQSIIRKLSCCLEKDTQNPCWQRGPWEAGRGRACLRMELSGRLLRRRDTKSKAGFGPSGKGLRQFR